MQQPLLPQEGLDCPAQQVRLRRLQEAGDRGARRAAGSLGRLQHNTHLQQACTALPPTPIQSRSQQNSPPNNRRQITAHLYVGEAGVPKQVGAPRQQRAPGGPIPQQREQHAIVSPPDRPPKLGPLAAWLRTVPQTHGLQAVRGGK